MAEAGPSRSGWILDASAVLALLQEEPGASVVEQHLSGASICAVNLSEVAGKLVDIGMPEGEAAAVLAALGLQVIPFGEELAWRTASLRSVARAAGLSLGDRACLATGWVLGRPVLGADRGWAELDLPVPVHLIR